MPQYFHPLSSIRFVLALGVLLFHYGTNYAPFSSEPLRTLIEHSSFRVSFFFFISGFVMTLVYQPMLDKLTPKYFYLRRLTRLMPVYWLAFVITLVLVVLVKDAAPKGRVIILHALGLQTWNPGYVLDLNFTTWSVSVEIFFYLLFPFLLKPLSTFKPATLVIGMVVVWALQSYQHFYFVNHISDGSKKIEEFINDFPLWHLGTFLWGMGSARLLQLELIPKSLRAHSSLVFFTSLLLFLYIIYVPNPILKYIHNGLLSPLFALLVISLFYNRGWLHNTLSHPALSKLGDLSYGIFAFQYPVWLVFTWLASDAFKASNLFFFLYLGAVLVVSFLVSKYFEKPIMTRWRKKLSGTT
jgi:peptidoglycan/LPS O-acetylase OafA/YrhL